MARQPTLTVNVNSQQFQQFTRNFNAFSGQVRNLNAQFGQINAQLNRTTLGARAATASMNLLGTATNKVFSTVTRITGHFLKWSAIIGGITALLGMGGGLFGIERLAASILSKRRMVLGLGGDYGRTQASMIFSQSLLQNPQSALQNVRMGLGGSSDQMTALMSMGIPFGTKMSPDEVLDKVMVKAADIMKNAPKGTELLTAQAYKLDKLLDPMDLLRLSTEEGRKEIEERRKLIEQYKEQLKITPRATKAWAELEMQFQAAKAQIESVFGEKLADLAGPLKDLSEGFAHFVKIFMETPVIQRLIKKLGEGISWLADKLKNLTKEELDAFIKKIKEWLPSMDSFKSDMKDFAAILHGAVTLLGWLKNIPTSWEEVKKRANEPPTGATMAPPGTPPGTVTVTPQGKALYDKFKGFFTNPLIGPAKADEIQGPLGPTPPPRVPAPEAPSTAAPPAAPAAPPASRGFGAGASPFMFGGGKTGNVGMPSTVIGGVNSSWQNTIMNNAPAAPAASSSPASSAGGGASFTDRFGDWGGAAQKMTPKAKGGIFGRMPSPMGDQAPTMRGGPGPLSSNNWQMNRTANLVVRNVPGANIFMTASGMTG